MSILDIEPAVEKSKPVHLLAPPQNRIRQLGLAIFAIWILTAIYFAK